MERNGLVAFTLHHGTFLERSERLFLAGGNGVIGTYIQRKMRTCCTITKLAKAWFTIRRTAIRCASVFTMFNLERQ